MADSVVGRRIPTGTDVRWSSQAKSLNVVVEEWAGLKQIFETIINDPDTDSKTIRQASGFLEDFKDFEFAFLAVVFNNIFQLTNILFDILQKKALDIRFRISQIKKYIQGPRKQKK